MATTSRAALRKLLRVVAENGCGPAHPLRRELVEVARKEASAVVAGKNPAPSKFLGGGGVPLSLELANLINGVQEQQDLFAKYGIGTSIDQRTKIRRTGARVGLQVPDFSDEFEKRLDREGSS